MRLTSSRRLLALAAVVAVAAAGSAAVAAIEGDKGVINACVSERGYLRVVDPEETPCSELERALWWNETGPPGPPGPPGPAGPSDAFSVEDNDQITIPTGSPTTLLTLSNVPGGKYVIVGNAVVHNMNASGAVPVNCWLGAPSEYSPPYGARLDPYDSTTGSGASGATIALTLTTQFASQSNITLSCHTNTGQGAITASIGSRQITAIKVGSLTEEDLAP